MRGNWFFRIFAGAMIALGFWLLLGGEVVLPTRSPPRAFHFTGLSLWLLAASPALIGVAFWSLAEQADRRNQPIFRLLIGVGMAALGLAFVLAYTR